MDKRQTLNKQERLCSRKVIEALFAGGHKSWAAFPLRLVSMPVDGGTQMMVSVSKRRFHHAVDRNRVKRLVREAYRRNKHLVADRHLALAFIFLSAELPTYDVVEQKVRSLLTRAAEFDQEH